MPRTFKDNYVTQDIIRLLDKLIDKTVGSQEYANTMYELGKKFGSQILGRLSKEITKVAVASTVEDADFLSKGIVDVLEENGKEVLLTVFWNQRFKPNTENGISVAPIIKEFHEEGFRDAHTLIITKSIISSSCVVKTNLNRLIEQSNPEQIMVVAPVLLKGARNSLESEFDQNISKKFEYYYFAEDDKKTPDGLVDPGIGGDVYKRLGFAEQDEKNKYIPSIVKERRYKHVR
jgi:hypothetical protein